MADFFCEITLTLSGDTGVNTDDGTHYSGNN